MNFSDLTVFTKVKVIKENYLIRQDLYKLNNTESVYLGLSKSVLKVFMKIVTEVFFPFWKK